MSICYRPLCGLSIVRKTVQNIWYPHEIVAKSFSVAPLFDDMNVVRSCLRQSCFKFIYLHRFLRANVGTFRLASARLSNSIERQGRLRCFNEGGIGAVDCSSLWSVQCWMNTPRYRIRPPTPLLCLPGQGNGMKSEMQGSRTQDPVAHELDSKARIEVK